MNYKRGIVAFLRAIGACPNPMSPSVNDSHIIRTKDEDRKRRKSHAQFKIQRIARRIQRIGR